MAIVTNVRVSFWKKKTLIESTLSVLVQLNYIYIYIFLNGASKKIIDNRINAIPTSIVTINKKRYKIMSAIFYEGEEMNRHYIYMLRADKSQLVIILLMIYKLSRRNGPGNEHKEHARSSSRLSKCENNFYI